MNIDDLTFGEAREICRMVENREAGGGKSHSLEVGKCYLIRTLTMMYTGRLTGITDSDIVLSDAAWIADSGRYSDALKNGTLDEVEPYPNQVIVSRAVLVDAAQWTHVLPREKK